MKGYFLGMAERTGTLWEHCDERASCNHGFASHICVHLYRDILGIRSLDPVRKTITIEISKDLPLETCSGTIPVVGGEVFVRWHKDAGKMVRQVDVPSEWTVV